MEWTHFTVFMVNKIKRYKENIVCIIQYVKIKENVKENFNYSMKKTYLFVFCNIIGSIMCGNLSQIKETATQ